MGREGQRKVVIRKLPTDVTEEQFLASVAEFKGRYNWSYFRPGKTSIFPNRSRPGVAYLRFADPSTVYDFHSFVEGGSMVVGGKVIQPQVEFAPCQRIPRARKTRDSRQGRYESDRDYMAFLASLEAKSEAPPTPEINADAHDDRGGGEETEANAEPVAPIVAFLHKKTLEKKRRAAAEAAARKKAAAAVARRRDEQRAQKRRKDKKKQPHKLKSKGPSQQQKQQQHRGQGGKGGKGGKRQQRRTNQKRNPQQAQSMLTLGQFTVMRRVPATTEEQKRGSEAKGRSDVAGAERQGAHSGGDRGNKKRRGKRNQQRRKDQRSRDGGSGTGSQRN